MDFKDHWDLETALKVVQNETVDARLWAEAVEWLLLYGPQDIVAILLQASEQAFAGCLPEIQALPCDSDGQPCRTPEQLAGIVGVGEDHLRRMLADSMPAEQLLAFFTSSDTETIH